MAEDSKVRLENFRTEWKARELTPVEAKRLYGRSVSFWSDLLHGRKSFGEKLARSLEDQLGLPRMWLDKPRGKDAEPSDFGELTGDERLLFAFLRGQPPGAARALFLRLQAQNRKA